jgi:hypothetical protein
VPEIKRGSQGDKNESITEKKIAQSSLFKSNRNKRRQAVLVLETEELKRYGMVLHDLLFA